jgi:uncharacterized protein (TIGR00369 family)
MGDRERLVDDLRERLAATDFYRWAGIELLDASPGEARVAMTIEPHHLNIQGLVHGGLVATIADTAMGLAVRTRLEPGRRHVTIQLGVSFLSPAAPGTVVARGRVVRAGRQVAFAESEVVDATGKLLAKAQATIAVTADRGA